MRLPVLRKALAPSSGKQTDSRLCENRGMDQDLREHSRVKIVDVTAPAPNAQVARRTERPMIYWLDEPRDQNEFVKVRTVWVTITLSLLVHVAALFLVLERTKLLAPFDEGPEVANDRLQVKLAAIPTPPPAPEPQRPNLALPKPPTRSPPPPARRVPPPAVIASTRAAPTVPTPPVPAPPVPAPPRPNPPVESDLWSYMQKRRQERGEPVAPPITTDKGEPNANIAANLPTAATGVATADRSRGGGIFEIKRLDYDDAAFLFFGWNKDMGRRTPQLIEVRKGDNSDMRIAVVRKMISIIREHEKGDFWWQSPRHDHDILLSARVSDNATLEDFLMHDFFDDPRQMH
jgi:hypothetical protein